MPRPIWSGAISFGLVSIPVKLVNAVQRKTVSFNQLDGRDGQRIRYRKVNAATGEEVPEEHIVRAYEWRKGQYVVVEDGELEPLLPSASRAVELEVFVDAAEIDPILFDAAYYLVPDGPPKPYALLARAMADTGKVGVARFVMRNRQHLAAIRAVDGRLVLSTLVYADEVVDPATVEGLDTVAGVELSEREVAMAEQLVASLAGPFEHEQYRDTYRDELLALIEKKAAGETVAAPEPAATAPHVVDLMAALEASVQAAREARQRHPTARAATRREATEAAPEKAAPRRRARKTA